MKEDHYLRLITGKVIILLTLGLLFGMVSGAFAEESSCIVCHTDEKMLAANLSLVKEKSLTRQSGHG